MEEVARARPRVRHHIWAGAAIFKAFGEQWEADAIKSHTEMGEFPLAEKYAGIKFFDSVTNEHFIILAERCQWIKRMDGMFGHS